MSNGVLGLIAQQMPSSAFSKSSGNEMLKEMEEVWRSCKAIDSASYIIISPLRVRKRWRGKTYCYTTPLWNALRGRR